MCRATIIGSRKRGLQGAAVLIAALALLGFRGPPQARAAEQTCGNEQVRDEQESTFLPGCRAYELVSPSNATPFIETTKIPTVSYSQSSTSGDSLSWFGFYPIEGSEGGGYNISVRDPTGWASESLIPRLSASQEPLFACNGAILFSEDLSSGVLMDGEYSDALNQEGYRENPTRKEAEYCGGNDPALVEDEPRGFENLFAMDFSPRGYELLNSGASAPQSARLQAASPDLSDVVFEENAALLPGALPAHDLYEASNGALRLVSVLPSGGAVAAELADGSTPAEEGGNGVRQSAAQYAHAMSSDGSEVFFRADGNLYARLHATAVAHAGPLDAEECLRSAEACTIQVDASQKPGGRGGAGQFLAASGDGSKVFFVDESAAELTEDTATGPGLSLYEYEVGAGKLTDLTPAALSEEPDVLGFSGIGESEGRAYLYFAADGKLASAATSGRPNLYLSTGTGAPLLVATLEKAPAKSEAFDWQPPERSGYLSAEVSPDGRHFVFQTANVQALTGYDNLDVRTGEADEEVLLYEAGSGSLRCASCDPGNRRPIGSADLGGLIGATDELLVSEFGPNRQLRNVLDSGSVFFDSPDGLVENTKSGAYEVYEYAGGQINLISSGTSAGGSYFYEADPSGEDVFFITSQSLTKADGGNTLSIYDARVDGGFAEPSEAAPCKGEEECRGAAGGATVFEAAASSTFSGPGNLPAGPATTKPQASLAAGKASALRACRRAHRKKRARRKCERAVQARYSQPKQRGLRR